MASEALLITINEKGALQVKRNLDKIGKSAARSSKGVKLLKGALAGLATIGLGVVLIQSIKLMAQFGQEMATVKAITGATESEFAKLNETARELGKNTRFTAVQAAEGMKFLSRAGFTANETMVAVGHTLNLAQAGALDLGTAARLTAQTIKGFRLEVDQAGRVADVLAKAANSSNTDVTQLGDAIKFAAPAAAGLGVSLEETTSAIQLLSDAGLQGTLAGTGLRKAMIALESPTKTGEKILSKFHLTTADVKISTLGLTQVMTNLRDAGVDTGEMYKLLGVRAGAAGEVLTQVIPQLIENRKRLDEAGGTAQEVADIMDATLNGALLRVKSALQSVILEAGTLGADTGLTQFMNGLATVLRFVSTNLDTLTKAATAAGVALLIAFGPRIMAQLVVGVKALGTQIAKLWALMTGHPLIAVAAIIAGLITALILFRNEINILGDDMVTLGTVFEAAWNVITGKSDEAKKQLKTDADEISDGFKITFQDVTLFLLAMLKTAFQIIDKVVGSILGSLRGIAGVGQFIGESLKKGMIPSASGIGKAFQTNFEAEFNRDTLGNFIEDTLAEAQAIADRKHKEAVAKIRDQRKKADVTIKGPGAKRDFGPMGPPAPEGLAEFNEVIRGLKQENALLKLNSQEREIRKGLLQIESELNTDLKGTQEEAVLTLLNQNQALEDQARILEEIRGPQMAYERSVAALDVLMQNELLTLDEYNKKLKELKETQEKNADTGEGLGNVLKGAFSKAQNAMGEFIRTGKLGFTELADSILSDIARIAAQQAAINFLKFIGGGLPFQHGGSFKVGGTGGPDSQFVPLALTPGERVDISTPQQQQARQTAAPVAAPPVINIINILDESLIIDVMAGAEGEATVMNHIQRNPTLTRQAVS